MWCNGGWRERLGGDVPFEFICEVARARALAEAGHVEGGAAAARHFCSGGLGERGDVAVVGDGCGGAGSGAGWHEVDRFRHGEQFPVLVGVLIGVEAGDDGEAGLVDVEDPDVVDHAGVGVGVGIAVGDPE